MNQPAPAPTIPANVKMQPVSHSSNVDEIGYDAQAKDLYIKFKNGGTYRFAEVPAEVWKEIQSAPSTGKFIHARIKGTYKSEKVSA